MWDRTLNAPSKFQNRDPSPIVWSLKPGSLPGTAGLLICPNGPQLHPRPENKGSAKLPPYTTCLVLAEGFRTRLPSPWEVWRTLGSFKVQCLVPEMTPQTAEIAAFCTSLSYHFLQSPRSQLEMLCCSQPQACFVQKNWFCRYGKQFIGCTYNASASWKLCKSKHLMETNISVYTQLKFSQPYSHRSSQIKMVCGLNQKDLEQNFFFCKPSWYSVL